MFFGIRMAEGLVRNFGALLHVDPWLCPLDSLADALAAMIHTPGGHQYEPVFDFSPVFKPMMRSWRLLACRLCFSVRWATRTASAGGTEC